MSKWQPIETAPKDHHVLLYSPTFGLEIRVGRWDAERCVWIYGRLYMEWHGDLTLLCRPSHWMPLPEPPK